MKNETQTISQKHFISNHHFKPSKNFLNNVQFSTLSDNAKRI